MKINFDFLTKIFGRRAPTSNVAPVFHPNEASNLRGFPGIIAAKVVEVQKHPNADRLRIVKLDVGGNMLEPVVCGANNFEAGAMVALALPGASIAQNIHSETHEPFVLGKAKIRGVESQGMICAAFELGLANEPGQGIMILKSDITPGSQFNSGMVQ
ncbi:MAG: hypothetical protein P4L74_04860 [Candidatus Doudnabacteria bacterium]|nr:hypothetical protein [Candidatus Doudnabacteria bacterium]